jgi:tetratricopeptide (TPR) repeat protein/predicted Ser/Thr protein kinase
MDSDPHSTEPPEPRRPSEDLPATEEGPQVAPASTVPAGELATTRDNQDMESAPSASHLDDADMPRQLGEYRLIRLLGAGAMGVVYLAEQARPRRTVALKVVRFDQPSEQVLQRFEQELEILGRLSHPGIARVYDAGTAATPAGPRSFIAMEHVSGVSLTRFASERQLDTRARLELMIRVCDAVQYAHQQGVIHRDLKPANILVEDNGQPKVLDFGLARVIRTNGSKSDQSSDDPTPSLTMDNTVLGTIAYMAPEQARGRRDEVDTRSDVYALAVMTYELLAGRRPHDLTGLDQYESLRRIVEDEPEPLRSVQPRLRGDLDTILAKGLEKDKERRYSSSSEFAGDLRRFLRDEPITARQTSAMYQLRKLARRNRAVTVALAALLLAVLAGSGALTWGLIQRNRWANTETARLAAELEKGEVERAAERERVEAARAQLVSQYLQAGKLHAERGNWHEAMRGYDQAREAGHPDTARFLLDRILVSQGISNDVFDGELARLDQLVDNGEVVLLGTESGELLLYRAVRLEGRDPDAVDRLIQQALQHELPEAQRHYALGMTSTTTAGAIEHFRQAVERSPFHLRARHSLALSLLLSGEHASALETIRVTQALYPDDSTQSLMAILCHMARQDLASARAELEQARESLPEAAREVGSLIIETLSLLLGQADPGKSLLESLVGHLPAILRAVIKARQGGFELESYAQQPPAFVRSWLSTVARVAPNLHEDRLSRWTAASLLGVIPPLSDERAVDLLADALAVNPEGSLYALQGILLMRLERHTEAEPALAASLESPCLLPLQHHVHQTLLFCRGLLLKAGSVPRDPNDPAQVGPLTHVPGSSTDEALKQRTVAQLETFYGRHAHTFWDYSVFWRVAVHAGDLDLAKQILLQGRRKYPHFEEFSDHLLVVEAAMGNVEALVELSRREAGGSPDSRAAPAYYMRAARALDELQQQLRPEEPASPADE